TRNPKADIPMSETAKAPASVLGLLFWCFGFVSGFGFRISSLSSRAALAGLLGFAWALCPEPPRGVAQDPPPAPAGPFDVVIRGGTVYDGTGSPPVRADVALRGDRIVAIGQFAAAPAKTIVEARDLAVAPGFINMLSWSNESLLVDGRS